MKIYKNQTFKIFYFVKTVQLILVKTSSSNLFHLRLFLVHYSSEIWILLLPEGQCPFILSKAFPFVSDPSGIGSSLKSQRMSYNKGDAESEI